MGYFKPMVYFGGIVAYSFQLLGCPGSFCMADDGVCKDSRLRAHAKGRWLGFLDAGIAFAAGTPTIYLRL